MYNEEITEETLQSALEGLVNGVIDEDDAINWNECSACTFENAGLLTYDKGVLIRTPDGKEFQLTIVRRR